jgi:hypothetical protein
MIRIAASKHVFPEDDPIAISTYWNATTAHSTRGSHTSQAPPRLLLLPPKSEKPSVAQTRHWLSSILTMK